MELKVIRTGDPRLRKKSVPIKKLDKKTKALIQDLKDTLIAQRDPEGVGLAAPQVGKNLQLFIISYEGENNVIINPKVLDISKTLSIKKSKKGKKDKSSPARNASSKADAGGKQIVEGCLSLPHYYGPLVRENWIKVEYLNEQGKKEVREFKDFMAQIVQHELDHLNGILFLDRILEQKKPLYKVDGDDWEEVELE